MHRQPNIIFFMLDTVRADIMSSYGGPLRLDTIDTIARKSLVFENAVAPGTYTLPSHLSIFLGKRPRKIRPLLKDNIKYYNDSTDPFLKKVSYVRKKDMTLAKHLSYLGYNTALFSSNPFLSPEIGITNGFSHVENIFIKEKLEQGNLAVKAILNTINSDTARNNLIRLAYAFSHTFPENTLDSIYLRLRKMVDTHYSNECGYYNIDSGAERTNRHVKKYLESERDDSNFIFINYMEGHEGYPTNLVTDREFVQDKWLHVIGHSGIEDALAEKVAYMKRIAYLDKKVGQMMDILKRRGILDNAFVIFASDHGQAFMEHGQMYHNMFPYNEITKVPLIISKFEHGKQKNIARRVEKAFSLTSLNKVIPDMGYGTEEGFEKAASDIVVSDHLGITEVWDTYLLKLLRKRSKHADMVYKKKLHFNKFSTAIVHGRYKLMHFYGRDRDELYDIKNDPVESINLIGKHRDLAHKMVHYNTLVY